MGRVTRAVVYILIGVAIAIIIGLAIFFYLTRSQAGLNRLRDFAIERIEASISGRLEVEKVTTTGVFGGITLHDVSLTDLEGRPFVRADSIRLGYRLRSFLAGNIVFNRAIAYDPVVVIEQLPGDTLWNFEHIFPPSPPTPEEKRSLIQIDRVQVISGTAIVRYPITPEAGKTITPSDTARMIVRHAPGGPQRELRFERINATVPRILWESPLEPGKLIEVASLSAMGYLWTEPFDLRNLRGAITIRDSLIAFDVPGFALPDSRGSALGEVITTERVHYDLRIEADQVAFSDLEWLYPHLPATGGGSGIFRMQTQPVGTLYLVEDARLHAPGTNLAGTFGIVVDDTLYFTQVNLRASPLDLRLLHEVVPSAPLLEGLLVGTVEVEGPLSSLNTRGDLRLTGDRRPRRDPGVRWNGTLDLLAPYGAEALTVDLRDFDLALLAPYWRAAAAGGTVSGRLETTGALERALHFKSAIDHRAPEGGESRLRGTGTFVWTERRQEIDILARAETLDFAGLATLVPALARLEGSAEGTISARGNLDSLEIDAELLADAGRLQLQGALALRDGTPRYRAEGTLADVALDRLLTGRIPRETGFAAHFALAGEGLDTPTAWTDLQLRVDSARVARIDVASADLGARIEGGMARLDSLVITTALGALRAQGTLGLDTATTGAIQVQVNADSLNALRSIFFPDAPALVDPDSIRGRVTGAATIEAELRGALGALEVAGSARLRRPAIEGASATQLNLSFSAAGIGTDSLLSYRVAAIGDSLEIYGQKLDLATASIEFSRGGGWLQVEGGAAAPQLAAYHLISGFQPRPGGVELDLHELRARTGPEEWGLAEPTRVRIGADGVQFEGLLFSRTTGAGRITASGRLPWAAETDSIEILGDAPPANLRIAFEQLPLFSLRDDVDAPVLSVADLTGQAVVTGTAVAPRIQIEFALRDARVSHIHFERIGATLDYRDRLLEANLEASQDGRNVLVGSGRIPLDLRLAAVDERRLDEPLTFTLRADGVPAAIVGSVLDGFRAIEGRVDGILSLGGTTRAPAIGGHLTLRDGAATVVENGVRYRGVSGTARVLRDQVVDVDLTARTTGGSATIGGTMDFRDLTDPTLDLHILARNFQAARRRDVELTASGELRLKGSYSRPEIDGKIRVDRGTLYLDEVWRQYQIVALDDPTLELLDSTYVADYLAEQQILDEEPSEFVKNLRVNAEIEIGRDSWLRSRNLNVEAGGRLQVEFNRSTEDIRLIGSLNAIRGTYELYVAEGLPARRFVVRGGTVDFDGTPGINPGFDITASYRVRTADRQPINLLALVTGNLENPRVTLKNDGDELISESDLLSYLVFGRPTYALAGGEARQLDSYLTGLGAGLVAPTFLGYWAMLGETIGGNFGIDYLSLTPTEADSVGVANGLRAFDPFSALGRAQLEVGNYLGDAWYIALTHRLGQGVKVNNFGVRLEWRLAPTWSAEFFIEDRFARLGQFGFDQPIESRKVGGLFLFREWGF
jgi:translocation and assembly module TamB